MKDEDYKEAIISNSLYRDNFKKYVLKFVFYKYFYINKCYNTHIRLNSCGRNKNITILIIPK